MGRQTAWCKQRILGSSLAVQWLGLSAFPFMASGSIPGQRTKKILQAVWCNPSAPQTREFWHFSNINLQTNPGDCGKKWALTLQSCKGQFQSHFLFPLEVSIGLVKPAQPKASSPPMGTSLYHPEPRTGGRALLGDRS